MRNCSDPRRITRHQLAAYSLFPSCYLLVLAERSKFFKPGIILDQSRMIAMYCNSMNRFKNSTSILTYVEKTISSRVDVTKLTTILTTRWKQFSPVVLSMEICTKVKANCLFIKYLLDYFHLGIYQFLWCQIIDQVNFILFFHEILQGWGRGGSG